MTKKSIKSNSSESHLNTSFSSHLQRARAASHKQVRPEILVIKPETVLSQYSETFLHGGSLEENKSWEQNQKEIQLQQDIQPDFEDLSLLKPLPQIVISQINSDLSSQKRPDNVKHAKKKIPEKKMTEPTQKSESTLIDFIQDLAIKHS